MAKISIKNNGAKKQMKPAKDRTEFKAGKKQKDPNAPKKPTPGQEAKERHTLKDNAASIARMAAFVQRPPPAYMTAAQFDAKTELLGEKEELLALVTEGEKRLQELMGPIQIVKIEVGDYKSRLNYLGVELRAFKGLREPAGMRVGERVVIDVEEDGEQGGAGREEGMFVAQE